MYKGFVVLSVGFFLLLATCARALTIDDFSAGPLDVTLNESNLLLDQVQTGLPETAVVGGIRKVTVILDEPSIVVGAEARAIIDSNAGFFRVSTNTSLEAIILSYGDGPGQTLDLDLTGYHAFRVDIISATSLGSASFSVRSGDEAIRNKWDFHIIDLPASDSPYSVVIPFNVFLRGVDFSDIDFIRFNGGAGTEFILGGFFAIPEPTSVALLIAASLSLLTTRQRHRA